MDTNRIVNAAVAKILPKLREHGIDYKIEHYVALPGIEFDAGEQIEFNAIKLIGDERFIFSRTVPIKKIQNLGADWLAAHLWDDVLVALAEATVK
jgi:hypothetical protein